MLFLKSNIVKMGTPLEVSTLWPLKIFYIMEMLRSVLEKLNIFLKKPFN